MEKLNAELIADVRRVFSPILKKDTVERYIKLVVTAESSVIARVCNYDVTLCGKATTDLPGPHKAEMQALKTIWNEFSVANYCINHEKTTDGLTFSAAANAEADELRQRVETILRERFNERFGELPEKFYRHVDAAKRNGFYVPVSSGFEL